MVLWSLKKNLSHEGNCWIDSSSSAIENSVVCGNAKVLKNSTIAGNATVKDNSIVMKSRITDFSSVSENSIVRNSIISISAVVKDNAHVFNSEVYGECEISGNSIVRNSVLQRYVKVLDNAKVIHSDLICSIVVEDSCTINHCSLGGGELRIGGSCNISFLGLNGDFKIMQDSDLIISPRILLAGLTKPNSLVWIRYLDKWFFGGVCGTKEEICYYLERVGAVKEKYISFIEYVEVIKDIPY